MDIDLDKLLITDRQKIIEIHGKTKGDVDRDIGIILEWFKSQKHLPEVLSRNAIERILVNTKFSIERTKKICDTYYTARTLFPDIFKCCDIKQPEQKIYMDQIMNFFPLPTLTKDFYRVSVLRYKDFQYSEYSPIRHVAQGQLFFEVQLQEDLCMGDIIIVDIQHIRKNYVLKWTPIHLKTSLFFLEQSWASRVKGIHFVNVPGYAEVSISLLKSIMKKKILDRVHMHNSAEKLLEFVPKEVLPKDYGGEERSLEELNELWKLKLNKYAPIYEHLLTLKVNESLRPEPLVNSDILGYYGNFKKLDVD